MADTLLTPNALPIRPWDYIRRRRQLAGLTIEQAARPYWHRPEHRADVEAATRLSEQPGVFLKPYMLKDMTRAHSFDADLGEAHPQRYGVAPRHRLLHPRQPRDLPAGHDGPHGPAQEPRRAPADR